MKFLTLLFLFASILIHANEKKDKIVIAGPFASVSHPVLHMIERDALKDVAKEVEFRLWKNPDELRALAIKGDVDFLAVPTNTGAILNNKGIDIKLLNVSVWGILGMISRDNSLKSLKDYKGKTIAVPFRADMPDIVMTELMKRQGLDPQKDFKLQYVSSPIDAMQMLILRRVDHALLAEPAISIALRKTKSFPVSVIAPDLYRSVDLQKEWAEVFNTNSDIPQAGMAVMGRMKDEHIINRFMEEYDKSLEWYKTHPKEAGILVVKTLDMLSEEGLADSIPHVNLKSVKAAKAKEKLEFFFNILKDGDPKAIGNKLPSDNYYYGL
ncbi:ABC transporter substrate-binding protein [Sulfurimonas lithotrophica]|uniref:ABC transporter substrate-binding protein n=1 Tax=Sulfurimonas lithotrophica TaxID=2590022 RepID=A0A5P8P362_9BACT|nr:ABC transporter substrate-binding protein [Sulfurimonas lithotrophica]QFR49980.1 ABC transporter substrate-binding protein [Sulfurimonas lithotrophica]